jgi:hypothetical protein
MSRHRFWYLLLPVAVCGLLVGCGSQSSDQGAQTVPATTATATAVTPASTARSDARSLLDLFRPPPGAKQLSGAPKPLPDRLNLPFPDFAGSNTTRVLLTSWWSYPGTLRQANTWFAAHPPTGTVEGVEGSGTSPAATAWYRSYDRPLTAQLAQRSLGISAQTVGGRTLLRVDAESVWLPVRPADSMIPAGATRVVVKEQLPGQNGTLPKPVTVATVTDPRLVSADVAAFNGLTVPIPGAWTSCGMDTGRSLSFAFYQGGSATAAATAHVQLGGCNAVDLSVRGGAQSFDLESDQALSRVTAQLPLVSPTR